MVDGINGNFFQQQQKSKPQETPKFGLDDTANIIGIGLGKGLEAAAGFKPLKNSSGGNIFDGYFR